MGIMKRVGVTESNTAFCLSMSYLLCYADRIFTISERCRDNFGEIVCSAAVTLVCIRYALVRLVAAYRRLVAAYRRFSRR